MKGGGDGDTPRRKIPEGKFDNFWPSNDPTWIHVSPHQSYTYEIYDSNLKQVVKPTTPWFEFVEHTNFPKLKARRWPYRWICSSGAHKDQPCHGCEYMEDYYDRKNAAREKGVELSDKPAISRRNMCALGITLMEPIYRMSKLKDGKVQTRKDGSAIHRYIPFSRSEGIDGNAAWEFGRRYHWAMSHNDLEQLQAINDTLKNRCGNCTADLQASKVYCPDCESPRDLRRTVRGEEMQVLREHAFSCSECGYKGPMIPRPECTSCDEPVQGGLTSFDVRIRRVKRGTVPVIEVVGIRPIGQVEGYIPDEMLSQIQDSDMDRVKKYILHPLKLDEIYAPDPLDFQSRCMGEGLMSQLKSTEQYAADYPDPAANVETDRIGF